MASHRKALKAIISNYVITCSHFESIAASSIKNDASKAKGLLKKLKSPKFLTFLHFMMDFTEVIGGLSEAFQADDLLVMDAITKVEAANFAMVEMKIHPGKSISTLTGGNVYRGVTLSGDVKPMLDQRHMNLLDCGIDHMGDRFRALQIPPLSDFSVLNYRAWPYDTAALAAFGNEQVQRLVQHFAPVLTKEEVEGAAWVWPAFKYHMSKQRTSDPKQVYRDLLLLPPVDLKLFLPLIEIMMVHSMSTAIVERGFSIMNVVKDARRSLLGNDSLNDLMEIKINGPTLADFTPDSAIDHWLKKAIGTRHINGHKL